MLGFRIRHEIHCNAIFHRHSHRDEMIQSKSEKQGGLFKVALPRVSPAKKEHANIERDLVYLVYS